MKRSIFFGILIGIISVFTPIEILSPIAVLLYGFLFIVIFILLLGNQEDMKFLLIFCILGFFIRIISSILFFSAFEFMNLPWYSSFLGRINPSFVELDSTTYSVNGLLISKIWHMGLLPAEDTLIEGLYFGTILGSYDYWNAFVYYFTGYSKLTLVFINSFASSLTILFIYLIARQLFNRHIARLSTLFVALWPSLIFFSTQNVKEPLSVLLACIAIWGVVGLNYRFRLSYIVGILISLGTLAFFRYETAILLVVAIILSVFISISRRLGFILFLVILFQFCHFVQYPSFLEFYHRSDILKSIPILSDFWDWESQQLDISILTLISEARRARSASRLAFLPDVDISTFFNLIKYLPFGIFALLFAPFPWQLGSIRQVFVAPEMIVWYCLIPFLFYGIFNFFRYLIKKGSVILIFIFITGMVILLFDGNIGTLFRHKSVLTPFLLVFIAYGLVIKREKSIPFLK